MLKLDNNLLQELGLGTLPEEQKQAMLQHIYETLELRVGTQLANQMTDKQLEEFEKFIDAGGDQNQAQALQWLEMNLPNYKQVVNDVFEALKVEITQMAPQIMASAQQAGVAQPQSPQQAVAQPYQQPQVAQTQPQQQYQPAPDWQQQQPQPASPPTQPQPSMPQQGQQSYQPAYGQPTAPPAADPAQQQTWQQPQSNPQPQAQPTDTGVSSQAQPPSWGQPQPNDGQPPQPPVQGPSVPPTDDNQPRQ